MKQIRLNKKLKKNIHLIQEISDDETTEAISDFLNQDLGSDLSNTDSPSQETISERKLFEKGATVNYDTCNHGFR